MAHSATLMALKKGNESNSVLEKKLNDTKRDCLVHVMQYLTAQGYTNTASELKNEGGGEA